MTINNPIKKALHIFQKHEGMLQTAEAIQLGIHPRILYQLRDTGVIQPIARGLFRLANLPELSQESWIVAAQKAPRGVICLISALSFHEITDQIPNQIFLALPQNVTPPRIKYPPLRIFHFSKVCYQSGIQKHIFDGVEVKIYSPEKTVVDCFKFRNQIGLDVALDALKQCISKYQSKPASFMEFARICRVDNIIKPYLEALS